MYSACVECKVSQLVRIFTSVERLQPKCPLESKEWTNLISALLLSHGFYCPSVISNLSLSSFLSQEDDTLHVMTDVKSTDYIHFRWRAGDWSTLCMMAWQDHHSLYIYFLTLFIEFSENIHTNRNTHESHPPRTPSQNRQMSEYIKTKALNNISAKKDRTKIK